MTAFDTSTAIRRLAKKMPGRVGARARQKELNDGTAYTRLKI